MDELSIARAAVARGYLTERQLAECRDIAGGGRSLLAILLEMGYLRPETLATLLAPRRVDGRALFWFVAGALPAFAIGAALALFATWSREAPVPPPEERRIEWECGPVEWRTLPSADVRAFYDVSSHVDVVRRIGASLVDPADCNGEPLVAVRDAHRAILQSPDRGRDTVAALALAEEITGGDPRAAYIELLQRDRGDDDARIGLARACVREGNGAAAIALLVGLPRDHSIARYWRGRAILTEVRLPLKVF
jgi:hypothetical protein